MSLADPLNLSKSGFSVKRGDLGASSFTVNLAEEWEQFTGFGYFHRQDVNGKTEEDF